MQPLQSRLVDGIPCLSLSGKSSHVRIFLLLLRARSRLHTFKYEYTRPSLPVFYTMAFYTTPSLPRTPSACIMNATLPSLPSELLNWSMWRYPKQDAPLTPPMTSTFQRRRPDPVRTTLPPISFLDRAMAPRMSLKRITVEIIDRLHFF